MSFKSFLLCLAFFCIIGCVSDNSKMEATVENIQGTWVVDQALRDDQPTETLEGGFFAFNDSIMTTNIYGTEEESIFALSDQRITHTSSIGTVNFAITSYQDTSMELLTSISGWKLNFKCVRAE